MKNFVKSGLVTTYANASAIESGRPALIGTLVGVASGGYGAAESGEYKRAGVFIFPKAGTLAILQGTKYDWDDTAKAVVATATGDFELGIAEKAADAAELECEILLNELPY